MNIIAPPKTGKSWLATDLALTVATGGTWLNTFDTVQGDVLIVDNELHPETTAHRIPMVAEARGLGLDAFCDRVFVDNLRGRLQNLLAMEAYFTASRPSTNNDGRDMRKWARGIFEGLQAALGGVRNDRARDAIAAYVDRVTVWPSRKRGEMVLNAGARAL